jgi:ribosome-binding protein aMBF1 (putative translation factor)
MKKYSLRCLQAIEALAGGRQNLADRLGVSVACIARWKWGEGVPRNQILRLLEVTPGKFTAEELLGKWDSEHDDFDIDDDGI